MTLQSVPPSVPAIRHIPLMERKALLIVLHVSALIAILIVAAGLRMLELNVLGYNSDEAVYAGQAAAIGQVPILKDIFQIFRAHPLLFQFVLGVVFHFNFSDWLGRLISAFVGVATVYLVYALGRKMYGKPAGLIAALFMALMPYHVIVSRQVLLDGPMMFFTTLSLYMMASFGKTEKLINLIACAAALGLAVLSKEIAVIMLGAIYAFLAISPEIRIRISDIFLSLVALAAVVLPYPLTTKLAGGGGEQKTQQYLVWQLFRRPNHTPDFYPTVVPPAIGVMVIIIAVLGLWILRRNGDWREKLLMLWIIVPIVYFQIWPTKGFQYLLPIAPAFVVLAARALTQLPRSDFHWRSWKIPRYTFGIVVTAGIALQLFTVSAAIVHPVASDTFLAGTGGVPGGREAGLWIREHVPQGATFMAIGPSMANIVKFYGYRQAYGLSVSPNPLRRNPSYEPINNPDFQIRTGELQYAVWDAFSAARSTFFSEHLMGYVHKYHGRVVHIETVTVTTPSGQTTETPVIVIYAMRQ
jgi:dolichyl-phosphate-mannose-protein mannosyltransferase